ncbi:cupin domain-containing protein [Spirillospora sp. CA-255316]
MLLLTTLEAWRAQDGPRFVLDEAGAVWAPDAQAGEVPDDTDALAVADATFPEGQVIAVGFDPAPAPPRGIVDRTHAARVRYARRGPEGGHVAFLSRPATAETLDLLPHPEGGWFRETWRSPAAFRPDGYPGERAAATGIYFLLPPGEESIWHAVRSDEVWLWHRGGPLTLLLGGDGDRPGDPAAVALGQDLAAGHVPQALVPAGTWQAARPATGQEVLVSCVVAPGFDFADFRAL